MGTRSLTIFKDGSDEIAVLYRQFDGYPSGHGKELRDYLKKFSGVTNGIAIGEKKKTANGMSCLAAQVIAHFKTDVGGFYLYPAGTRDAGEEYRYTVYSNGEPETAAPVGIMLKVESQYGENERGEATYDGRWNVIYDGPVNKFKAKD